MPNFKSFFKRRFGRISRQRFSRIIFLIINLIFIGLVFIRGSRPGAFVPSLNPAILAYYNNQRVTMIGRVCQEPEQRINSLHLTVCVLRISLGAKESFLKVKGRLLIINALYPSYNYGDWLLIKGRLQKPQVKDDFDYAAYLGRYNIYSLSYYPKLKILVSGPSSLTSLIYGQLLSFKQSLKLIIDRALPEPEAGLAGALLLGYRQALFVQEKTVFARVGLSHLVAISGTHVAILSALIIELALALGLNRRWAQRSVFLFLFVYPLITGLAASAIRASLMGALAGWALLNQRRSRTLPALFLAASLMLIINPRLLRDDVGFQLSFVAVLGLVYIQPILSRLLEKCFKLSQRKKIIRAGGEVLSVSLAAQLAVMPILAINFKQISLIAPLSNLAVLWTLPFILTCLPPALLLSALYPPFNVLWFAPAYFSLRFIILVSRFLAWPSWAAVLVNNFSGRATLIYYITLTGLIVLFNLKAKLKTAV